MFGCGKSEGRCGNRSRGVGKCGGRCEKVRWGVREGEGRLGDRCREVCQGVEEDVWRGVGV